MPEGGVLVGFSFRILSCLLLSIYLVAIPLNSPFLTYFYDGSSFEMKSKITSELDLDVEP